MSCFVQASSFAIGYHFHSPFSSEEEEHIGYKPLRDFLNLANVLGYFPIIGIISTIMRIILMRGEPLPIGSEEYKTFRKIIVVRALMEIMCLGVIFLFLDIIFTIGREIQIARGKFYETPDFA